MPPYTDAQLMAAFTGLRKTAFAKLASPLRDAVLERYEERSLGAKHASELAAVDRALFLHTTVP